MKPDGLFRKLVSRLKAILLFTVLTSTFATAWAFVPSKGVSVVLRFEQVDATDPDLLLSLRAPPDRLSRAEFNQVLGELAKRNGLFSDRYTNPRMTEQTFYQGLDLFIDGWNANEIKAIFIWRLDDGLANYGPIVDDYRAMLQELGFRPVPAHDGANIFRGVPREEPE